MNEVKKKEAEEEVKASEVKKEEAEQDKEKKPEENTEIDPNSIVE